MIHAFTVAVLLATPISITERIDNAFSDLSTAQAPIAQEQLHAYGLKILERLKHEPDPKIDNCVAFEKDTMVQVPCVRMPQ